MCWLGWLGRLGRQNELEDQTLDECALQYTYETRDYQCLRSTYETRPACQPATLSWDGRMEATQRGWALLCTLV